MKAICILAALLVAAPLACQTSAQPVLPVITNLVAVQRPGTFFVDVTYDMVDPDSPGGVYILAEASADNGTNYGISMLALSGDAGLVKPGKGKKLVWNAWTDWGQNYTTNARVRLIADDFPSSVSSTTVGNETTNLPPTTNLVWIPSGSFTISNRYYGDHGYVWISKSFWMGKYEVTQSEYQNVMSNNPSVFTGNPKRPVDSVSWSDANEYCGKLTVLERAAGRISTNWAYRLPTDAEWEHACRAGTTTTYSFGEDPYGNRLGFYAWYTKNSDGQTHEVGSRAPNRWGLYDMHGNVWEWCQDYLSRIQGNVTDPVGSDFGNQPALRGGAFQGSGAFECASGMKTSELNYWRNRSFGFRVVLAPVQ